MRLSPTPPTIAPSLAPTEADRAQAAATAEVLTALIGDCDAQLADLAAAHAHAAQDGALRQQGPFTPKRCTCAATSKHSTQCDIDSSLASRPQLAGGRADCLTRELHPRANSAHSSRRGPRNAQSQQP